MGDVDETDGRHVLEQMRLRLQGVVKGLGEIERGLVMNEQLPSWPSLQKSTTLLLHNLTQLQRSTTEHSDYLRANHPYPLPNFPARSQQGLLEALLRKKQAPQVEDWIIEGLRHAKSFCDVPEEWGITETSKDDFSEGVEGGDDGMGKKRLDEEEVSELWEWAGPAGNEIAREVMLESMEGGDEESGDEEEDEDEDEEDTTAAPKKLEKEQDVAMADATQKEPEAPRLPLSTMLKFMSTGSMPQSVDPEQQQREAKLKQEMQARARAGYPGGR